MPDRSPVIYRIKIKGHLDPSWAEWFDDMVVTHDSDGTSTLSGPLVDQTALQSVLSKLGDLNLTLISVNPDESKAKDE